MDIEQFAVELADALEKESDALHYDSEFNADSPELSRDLDLVAETLSGISRALKKVVSTVEKRKSRAE